MSETKESPDAFESRRLLRYLPRSRVLEWWKPLIAMGVDVKLFETDHETASLIEANIDRHNWEPKYWVDNNYGGIVIPGRSMAWVGIPKPPLFDPPPEYADWCEVLCGLLPINSWWRTRAVRQLRRQIVECLESQGMTRLTALYESSLLVNGFIGDSLPLSERRPEA